MDPQLIERRTEMLDLISKGTPLVDTIKDLAQKYRCPEKTLYNDWGRAKRWAPAIVKLGDPTLLAMLLRGLEEVIPRCWVLSQTADNASAKVGALRLAKETYIDLIHILQSLGIVIKLPEKVKFDVELTANLEQYQKALDDADKHNIQANSAGEQVDSQESQTQQQTG